MEDSPAIKKVKPTFYFSSALIVSALMWGWCAMENFTDLRLTRRFSTARSEPMSYWFAVVVTAIAFVAALWYWRRAVSIVAHGVVVDAKILNIGGEQGIVRDATPHYSLDGKYFTVRKSFYGLGDRSAGDVVSIVVDRRKPKRIKLNK